MSLIHDNHRDIRSDLTPEEQLDEIVKNIQHHFIYMMKKESVKQQEDYTKHFHGIKDLKNILL